MRNNPLVKSSLWICMNELFSWQFGILSKVENTKHHN